MEVKLGAPEIELLKVIFLQLRVKTRTGDPGIIHGMERFVSTGLTFKKQHLEILDQIASKVGLDSGVNRIS